MITKTEKIFQELVDDRNGVGRCSYGKGIEWEDKPPEEWIDFALEEAVDFCKYLIALKLSLEGK